MAPDTASPISSLYLFGIAVSEPPLPTGTSGAAEGNVGTFFESPAPALDPRSFAGGTTETATFTGYAPAMPGISLDPSTGILSGVPEETFDDTVTLQVTDGGGRIGSVAVPVRIHPRPWLAYDASVARLAKADIGWLQDLITRRVPIHRAAEAFEARDDDVKVVIDIATAS